MQGISDRPRNDWPLGPARVPALVLAVVTLLGLAAAFTNGFSFYLRLPIACLVAAAGCHAIRRLLRPVVASLSVDGSRVHMRERSGLRTSGELIGSPFVSPLFVGLRLHRDHERLPRSIGVFRHQMEKTDFRRLCATLRQREAG